ncbi:hypothetical protein CHF27_013710 [Romboutsia maritimum]|uniref:Uncharacterized protein n=1 Tax=Romboutsia maritimum TaxID=2020948 RepID=A0A371IPJ4_9FIRM|nr:hypothetical protein [Romboutsia maritimum]RDY22394.1 hypothetical protein CHF27_013710 [Romboutsia maritimum]
MIKFINFFKNIPAELVAASYWICLFVALFSILAIMCGFKDKGKWVSFSILIDIVICAVL